MFISSSGPNKERFWSSDFWFKTKETGNTSKIRGSVRSYVYWTVHHCDS